jgi:hypothetical protein
MAARFLARSNSIPGITIGVVDYVKFVSDKTEHFDSCPAILIAAANIELESNERHTGRAKLTSGSAATGETIGGLEQTTSRHKRPFRDHGIPLEIRDRRNAAVKSAGGIKTCDGPTRADGEKCVSAIRSRSGLFAARFRAGIGRWRC